MKLRSITWTFLSLGLVDSISTITSAKLPGSHIRGSHQIDSIWISPDLIIKATSFCPFNFGIGDYRIVLVDLDKLVLFGTVSSSSPIMKMRRLISSNPSLVKSYLAYLKEKISDYKIIPKLSTLINDWDQFPPFERKSSLNKIDN